AGLVRARTHGPIRPATAGAVHRVRRAWPLDPLQLPHFTGRGRAGLSLALARTAAPRVSLGSLGIGPLRACQSRHPLALCAVAGHRGRAGAELAPRRPGDLRDNGAAVDAAHAGLRAAARSAPTVVALAGRGWPAAALGAGRAD